MSEPNPPFKIFVTSPIDYWLNADQRAVKHTILDMLRADGFEVELMGESGMPYTHEKIWTLERTDRILRCCQGALVIGFPRWYDALALHEGQLQDKRNIATEYSHAEGALAFARHLPLLFLIEDGVAERGILSTSNTLIGFPANATASWIASDQNFLNAYARWRDQVKGRYHLFFGYSGGAKATADLITDFLRTNGVRVRDWRDFQTAGTVLQQIQKADKSCLGGIFLFTSDDKLRSKSKNVLVPRDNVIFEAGYFVSSKGEERVQIILETGTKILDDLGGQIYLPLEDRNNISSIQENLLEFVRDRIGCQTMG